MDVRKLLAGTAIASALLAGGPAFADAITDDLLAQGPGPATIGFSDYEAFGNLTSTTPPALQVGSTNYGVLDIRSITVNGNSAFAPGTNGYLVGVYSGITITSISGSTTGNSGGVFSIYEVNAAQLSVLGLTINSLFAQGTGGYAAGGCTVNTQCYNGITNAGGTDVLNFALAPGADNVNSADTLEATINGASVPPTGEASGYAVITGGTDAGVFGLGGFTTAIGTLADLSIADEFCPNGSNSGQCVTTVGDWTDESFDPVQAQIAAVPEPASMALLGTALVSLGFCRFRRRKEKDPRA